MKKNSTHTLARKVIPAVYSLFLTCILFFALQPQAVAQKAMYFDGGRVAQSIPVPELSVNNSAFTVEIWTKPDANNYDKGTPVSFNYTNGNGNGKFFIQYWGNNGDNTCNLDVFYYGTSYGATLYGALTRGVWNHIAVATDPMTNDFRIYVNGVLKFTYSGYPISNTNGTGVEVKMGEQVYGGENMRGAVDELRVWKGARSGADILANYQTSFRNPASVPNLLVDVNFENENPQSQFTNLANNNGVTNQKYNNNNATYLTPDPFDAPTATISASGSLSFCPGGSVTLTASPGDSYLWSNGATTQSINASATGAYSVTVTSGNNSSTSYPVVATLLPKPAVFINSSSNQICVGGSAALSTGGDGLVGYWKMDEGTGRYVYDYSGNNLNGYFVNNPTWNNSGGFAGSTASLNMGSGYHNNYVEIPDNGVINNMQQHFTIEAWIKLDGSKQDNAIVDRGNYNFLFEALPNGQSGLGFYNNYYGWSYSSTPLPLNQWTHVAVTYDQAAGKLIFYVNGVKTDEFTRWYVDFGGGPINIGRQSPWSCQCNYFSGSLDEIKLWSTTKTQTDLQASMNSALQISTPASFAWSPSTGLNTTSGSSVTASPSSTTTYTVTSTADNGCTNTASFTLSVNQNPPTVDAITGNTTLCMGTTSQLATTTTNGTWSSSNTNIATVSSSGMVTTVSPGTASISYTINPPGCGSISNSTTVTVIALPEVAAVTGSNGACPSATAQLADATAGGVWSSSNTSVATVSSGGLVSTLAEGTAVISYTVTSNGCSASKTLKMTVAPITATFTTQPTCAGVNNGTASVSAKGGGGSSKTFAINADYYNPTLLSIDAASGTTTLIGSLNVPYNDFQAMVGTPSGDLYAINTGNTMYKINPETGNATQLGYVGLYCWTAAMAADANGTIYITDRCGYVFTLNPSNLQVNYLGYMGYGFSGIAFDPTDGQLYACNEYNLYKINISNMNVSWVGSLNNNGYYGFGDLFFDGSGNLYGSDGQYGNNHLLKIDKTNGSTTLAGNFGNYSQVRAMTGGGGKSYTYLWDNGQTTANATGLTPGSHNVTITDVNGCSATVSVTVTEQAKPTVFNVTGGGARCENGGGIQIGLSGSQPGVHYKLLRDGNEYNNRDGDGNPIDFGYYYDAGTYTITASAANIPCTQDMNGSAVIVVNPLPDPNVTYTGANTICPGATLLLNAKTGSGYTYQWRKSGNEISGATNASYAAGETGYYSVKITTAAGCTSNYFPEVYVDAFPVPVITVAGATTFCAGGSRTLSSDNGGGRFTGYSWNVPGITNPSLTVTQAGNYTVTTTNGTCTATSAPVTINMSENTLQISATLVNPVTCENALDGQVSVVATGGTSPYTYGNVYDFNGNLIDNNLFGTTNNNNNFYQNGGKLVISPSNNATWNNTTTLLTKQVFSIATDITMEGTFNISNNNQEFFYGFVAPGGVGPQSDFRFGIGRSGSYFYAVENSGYNAAVWAGNQSSYDVKVEKSGSVVRYYYRVSGSGDYTLFYTGNYSQQYTTAKLGVVLYTNGGSGATGDDFKVTAPLVTTGLGLGTYNYTVYDVAGCSASASIVVPVSTTTNPIQLTGTATPATCANGTDGTVTLTPSQGSGQYSFDIFNHTFSDNGINANMFQTVNGSFTENSGSLRGDPTNNYPYNGDWNNYLYAKNSINISGDFTLEQSFKFDQSYSWGDEVAFGLTNNFNNNSPYYYAAGFYYSTGYLVLVNSGNTYGSDTYYPLTGGTWYDFKIEKKGTKLLYYVRQSTETTYTLVKTILNTNPVNGSYYLATNYHSYYNYYGGFNSKNWKLSNNPPTTGLAPGQYTYVVTDLQGGCTATAVVTVPVYSGPGALKLEATVTAASCSNGCSGSVSLNPSGGAGSYTYGAKFDFASSSIADLFNTSSYSSFSINNGELNSGTGANYYTDWNNNIVSKRKLDLSSDISVEGSFTFTGGNWGNLTVFGFTPQDNVTGSGNVSLGWYFQNNYLYIFKSGSTYDNIGYLNYNTSYDIKMEKTGSTVKYYLRQTGSGDYNLIGTTNYTASEQSSLALLSYNYYNGYYGTVTSKNWKTVAAPKTTNLCPGTYTYSVYDASGCRADATFTIVADPTVFSATANTTNASAPGACDGAVNFTSNTEGESLSAFTNIFNYPFSGNQLNGSLFETRNGSFTESNGQLAGNQVNLGYSSSEDNSIITTQHFADHGKLVYELSFEPLSGNNGTRAVFGFAPVSTVTGFYQYPMSFAIDNGNIYTNENGNWTYIANVSVNNWYDFKIEKAGTVVNYYYRPSGGSYVLARTSSYNGGDTEFRAGISYYQYSYYNYNYNAGFQSKNWKVTGDAPMTGLCEGTYTYTVANSGGCSKDVTFTIAAGATPLSATLLHTDASCYNSNDGTITVNATGGTAPYQYSVDGETWVANNVFSNLAAGAYHVQVKDAHNTTTQAQEITIAQPAKVEKPVIIVTDNCNGTSTLTTDAAGSLLWSTNETTATITVNTAGTYSVTQAVNGCTSAIASATASPKQEPYKPTVTVVDNCDGTSTLSTNAAGSLLWSNGETTPTITVHAAGYYSVTTTVNGCTSAYGGNAASPKTAPVITISASGATAFCAGGSVVLTSSSPNNNNWSTGETSQSITVSASGTYTVTVTGECPSAPASIDVTVNPVPVAAITAPDGTATCPGNTVHLASTVSEGYAFQWQKNGVNIEGASGSSYDAAESGSYTVIITNTNSGCVSAPSNAITVKIEDVTPPTITCSENISVTATSAAGAVVNYTAPSANDNCSGVTIALTAGLQSGAIFPLGTTTVTYQATDGAGLTAQCSFTVTVTGAAPSIVCPQNITVDNSAGQCGASVSFAATESTAIPAATITYSVAPGSLFPVGTTAVTATATNAVGSSVCTFYVTVKDVTVPVLSAAPANITVECNAVPAAAILTATDNCGTATVTMTETRTNGSCQNNYTLTRKWTATDAAGNTCSRTQVITVQDTQAPILSAAPADITVQCNAVPAAAVLTATDNCSAPAVVYNEVRTNGTSLGNYILTRTWTATDACGNSSSKTQVITVRDTQAPVPVIASLPVLTGNCSVVATAPLATDNCAGTITATTLNPTSYTAQGVYTITWSYNDGNGNTSTQQQRIVVKNTSGPVPTVSVLPVITGQCSAAVISKPTAASACTGVIVTGTTSDPLAYTAQGNYTIHWTYTDANGNKTYQDQQVIVKDNIAPVPNITTLPTIEGQCSVKITLVNSTRCTDNCWCCRVVCHCRSTDCNCRQWSEWIANILSYFFGGSTNDDHGCDRDDDVDDVNNLKMQAPTATDNCKGTILGTTTDPLSYSNQGTYTIHWKFDDGNGNITIQNQTVTVADVEAPVPVVSNLPALTGNCSVTINSRPTAKDNCAGTITATTADPLTYTTQGTFVIHWIYDDGHGNTSTQNQTVTVRDNTKPVITVPADVIVTCGAPTTPSATGTAGATDNCGTPTITYTDVTSGNTITRTWKATDAAGNYSTGTQTITTIALVTSLTSVPTSTVYTGGVATNLYLGYGAQSTTLQMCSLPAAGAPYTYAWSGTAISKLSSTTVASPVFTPTTYGYNTFSVTVTNKYGCMSTATISICVTDIRVAGSNGKVYVCHAPPGNPSNTQTLSVSVNAVDAHLSQHSSDRLGSCSQTPCNATSVNTTVTSNVSKSTGENTATTDEDLKVTVMPNPTTTHFTLKLESRYETPVNMRVMDARGRVIDAKSKIGANSTIQIGHNYSSGTYYAELIQGNTRKVVQLIKARG